jgi:hypothetical protein
MQEGAFRMVAVCIFFLSPFFGNGRRLCWESALLGAERRHRPDTNNTIHTTNRNTPIQDVLENLSIGILNSCYADSQKSDERQVLSRFFGCLRNVNK